MPHRISELEKLHDLHLPTPISSWALAPGWYFLIFLLSGMAWLVFRNIHRSRTQRQFKQHLLQMLMNLETRYAETSNSQKTCAAVSELLRRIALMTYPREQVAGLQGEAWLAFLSQTSLGEIENESSKMHPKTLVNSLFKKLLKPQKQKMPIDFTTLHTALLVYPYQPSLSFEQTKPHMEKLFQATRNWLQNQTLSKPITREIDSIGGRHV